MGESMELPMALELSSGELSPVGPAISYAISLDAHTQPKDSCDIKLEAQQEDWHLRTPKPEQVLVPLLSAVPDPSNSQRFLRTGGHEKTCDDPCDWPQV